LIPGERVAFRLVPQSARRPRGSLTLAALPPACGPSWSPSDAASRRGCPACADSHRPCPATGLSGRSFLTRGRLPDDVQSYPTGRAGDRPDAILAAGFRPCGSHRRERSAASLLNEHEHRRVGRRACDEDAPRGRPLAAGVASSSPGNHSSVRPPAAYSPCSILLVRPAFPRHLMDLVSLVSSDHSKTVFSISYLLLLDLHSCSLHLSPARDLELARPWAGIKVVGWRREAPPGVVAPEHEPCFIVVRTRTWLRVPSASSLAQFGSDYRSRSASCPTPRRGDPPLMPDLSFARHRVRVLCLRGSLVRTSLGGELARAARERTFATTSGAGPSRGQHLTLPSTM